MKKCFSLLLTMAMLLSMIPASTAATEIEPTTSEISAEEIVTIDPEQVREKAMSRIPEEVEDLAIETAMPETAVLGASNITISGTVTLPDGADEASSLRVYAIAPPKTDANGKVLGTIEYYGGNRVSIAAGQKSVNYSISVPAGKYAFAVYSYVPGSGTYMYYTYFNADGTVAETEFTANRSAFNSNKTVNLSMPKGEYTVNGTLTFSTAATQDTLIEIDLGQNQRNGRWQGQELTLKKGQKSLNFSFAVEEGSHYLEFLSPTSNGWLYSDLNGALSPDWDNHIYIGAYGDQSTINLTINGDALLGEAEDDTPTGTEVTVTVKLPAKLEKETQFRTVLMTPNGNSQYSTSKWVEAGATSYSVTMTPSFDEFVVGYYDATNAWSNYHIRYAADARYAAETGITTNYQDAKVFSLKSSTKITISEPSCYALKGTIKLDTARDTESAMYAVAEFGDGTCYAARAYFEYGQTQCNYTIYVPTTHKGSAFTLWAADTYETNSNRILESTYYAGGDYTLTGSVTLDTIVVPAPPVTLTGTFSLPAGMTAPKGGLAVEIEFDNESTVTYIIPEGKSSFQYALTPNFDENSRYNLYAYILNPTANMSESVGLYAKGSELNNITLQPAETVRVSGTITVPDACKDAASTFEVYYYGGTETNDYNGYVYLSVLPGATSAPYSLKVAKDVSIQLYARVESDGTGKLLTAEQYLQQDGSVGMEYDSVTLTQNLSNINFNYSMGKVISGTITAVIPGEYSGRVFARPVNGGDQYESPYIRFDGTECTFSVAVPQDDNNAKYLLYLNMYDGPEGALVDTQLYWSPNGMTTDRDDSNAFSVPVEGITKDLSIPKAKSVSGSILIGEGLPARGYYSGRVLVITEDNEYSTYFDSNDGRMTFSVNLPADYDGTCQLAVYCYSNDDSPENLVTYTNLYVAEDGTMTADKSKAKNYTLSADGLQQDVTILPGRTVTITFNAPADFSGDYEGYVYLYNLDSGSSIGSKDLIFSGTSGSVSYTMPYGAANYGLRVRMYSGPGVMTNTYYYSNGSWNTNYDSMTAIPLETDSLSLTLPAGKVITGSLVASDGSAINLGTLNANNSNLGYISLSAVTGSYLSNTYVVNADGTFSITIPEDATGTHTLYFNPNENLGCNVVESSYYYAENADAPVTSSSNATAIDVSGTVPHLNIMVDTGYVLTGTVKLADDATITSSVDNGNSMGYVRLYLRENVDSNRISKYVSVYTTKGSTSWNYSIAVPKKVTDYQFEVDEFSPYNNTTHNIYDGEWIVNNSISVSGDAVLPDVVLSKAKANISATIQSDKLASSDSDVYTYLYLVAGENTYRASKWLYSGDTISIAIPASETSDSYKLYYQLSNADGLDRGPVYVGANGVLTKNESEAAELPWTTTSHTLNLLEVPPYLTGKIYLPGYTDQDFDIYMNAYNSKYIDVNPDTVKTAEDGRKYVEYALESPYVYVGYTYRLYAYASYGSSVSPEDRLWVDDTCYVNPDGTVVTRWADTVYFTVPDTMTSVLDFTLADWESVSSDCILQSVHNIVPSADPVTYTYTYVYPGITSRTRMKITFNSLSDVGVTINGEYDSYISGSSNYVYTTDGVITIEMTVSSEDYYSGIYYGFGVTSIAPTSGHSVSEVADVSGSVFALSGSSDEAVMSDLKSGKTIYVSNVAPSDTVATVYAAIYDSTGKFLGIELVPMDFTKNADCVGVKFDSGYADAATLKVMLLSDSGFAPLMLNRTIAD